MRALAADFLELTPAHRRAASVDLFHADAAGHRTDQGAKIAAHALVFKNARHVLGNGSVAQVPSGTFGGGDALVGSVFTGDVTEIAADAEVRIDTGDNLVIQVEVAPIPDAIH